MPPAKTLVEVAPAAVIRRQITPRRTGMQNPQNTALIRELPQRALPPDVPFLPGGGGFRQCLKLIAYVVPVGSLPPAFFFRLNRHKTVVGAVRDIEEEIVVMYANVMGADSAAIGLLLSAGC